MQCRPIGSNELGFNAEQLAPLRFVFFEYDPGHLDHGRVLANARDSRMSDLQSLDHTSAQRV